MDKEKFDESLHIIEEILISDKFSKLLSNETKNKEIIQQKMLQKYLSMS